MASMTAPTGRKVWFLTDPIEDATRDWVDFRRNYQATFAAQLLYPQIDTYEIMPWPERIYERPYPAGPGSDERIRIPQDFASMMQVMTNALQEMPRSMTAMTTRSSRTSSAWPCRCSSAASRWASPTSRTWVIRRRLRT